MNLRAKVPAWRRWLNWMGGLAFIGALAWWIFIWVTAESRVQPLCAEIQSGWSLSQLQVFAAANGLSIPSREQGTTFLVESNTFGRHGCRVTLDQQRVVSSEYSHSD